MGRKVYLLHFSRPYKHARHYLGSAQDVEARLEEYRAGRAARLTQVAVEHEIELVLARTWRGGRKKERKLKRRKASPRLCPICRGKLR